MKEIITYIFHLRNQEESVFSVDIERPDRTENANREMHPPWTRLEYHQCSNCPLVTVNCKYCPAAVDIEHIAEKFQKIRSIERADIWVHTKERAYFKNCNVQDGLTSLLGLVLASSACPVFSRLKPLTYFHLPFATLVETIHHLIGTYLIKQHMIHSGGTCSPDWELTGIKNLYKELEITNIHFMNRIRNVSVFDANLNAIQVFVAIAGLVEMDVNEILTELVPLLDKGF
ncbi:MAG: DUF6901 family protein [Candidatus Loosdrechtia sp.]|uniref:DUF6901 family protein n=1 Tax=Candidatus Loosdrechtia sp. TaxID=3101272 RepID=UPI003A7A4A81|nr:MAG: hypothetical protein QY305_12690 [Candidatus Jettenia sp. AMX2]